MRISISNDDLKEPAVVLVTPVTQQTDSYVIHTDDVTKAVCARKNEKILVEPTLLELQTNSRYLINMYRWSEPNTQQLTALDNKKAASTWLRDDAAVFRISLASVYVSSIRHVLMVFVPYNAHVEVGTEDSFLVL